jgi:hypothetical protein
MGGTGMKYNQNQVAAIREQLRLRLQSGEAEGAEIVVALVSMQKAGRLATGDIKQILLYVYSKDKLSILKALHQAGQLMDQEMIMDIIREVEQETNR